MDLDIQNDDRYAYKSFVDDDEYSNLFGSRKKKKAKQKATKAASDKAIADKAIADITALAEAQNQQRALEQAEMIKKAQDSVKASETKDNTTMYVIVGGVVLLVGIVAFIFLRKKK